MPKGNNQKDKYDAEYGYILRTKGGFDERSDSILLA